MTLPRKDSRPITVGGVGYRWLVRGRPTYDQGLGCSPLRVAVEHARQPGAVLVVSLPSAHPSNWVGAPGVAVRPGMVACAITRALAEGWQPTQPGKPMMVVTDPWPGSA